MGFPHHHNNVSINASISCLVINRYSQACFDKTLQIYSCYKNKHIVNLMLYCFRTALYSIQILYRDYITRMNMCFIVCIPFPTFILIITKVLLEILSCFQLNSCKFFFEIQSESEDILMLDARIQEFNNSNEVVEA